MNVVVPAAAYGAGRQYLVNLAKPLTNMVPLGNYADEVVLGTAAYFVAKKNMFGLRKVAMAALTIEAASAGSQLIGGMGAPSGSSVGQSFVYG